jgi:hypothetical protein
MEIRPEYEVSVGEGTQSSPSPQAPLGRGEGEGSSPHDHSHDDHGEVHFWLRASITPGQLHALKRQLKDAQTEVQNLRAVIRAYLEHDEAANHCTCQACRGLVDALETQP